MPTFEIPDGPTNVELKRTDASGPAVGTVAFNVTNRSSEECDGRLSVVPSGRSDAAWFTIDGNRERPFAPGETQTATIRISAPAGIAAGDYPFRLRAVAVNDPDNDHAEGPVTTAKVPEVQPPAPPKRSLAWLWILIGLLVLAAIAAAAYFAFRPRPAPAPGPNGAPTFLAGTTGFSDGGSGQMWAGSGPRHRTVHVDFPRPFASPPTVVVAMSGLDAASSSASSVRISVSAQNVTARGFDIDFHTWADSRIWSTSVVWVAYKP